MKISDYHICVSFDKFIHKYFPNVENIYEKNTSHNATSEPTYNICVSLTIQYNPLPYSRVY